MVPPWNNVEGIPRRYDTHPPAAWLRIQSVERMPALYRTRVTHLLRDPVHHYFEHSGYSWYVDVDALPRLPRWIRPFARFDARDHFDGAPDDPLRQRVDTFLSERGVDLGGGRISALLQARVLGYVFNPVSLYWCHDADGALRHVVVEMHNTRGERHAYLLPPADDRPAMVAKKLSMSPFTVVGGHYLVLAPQPNGEVNVRISLHRDNHAAFVSTLRGSRRRAGIGQLLWLQLAAPLAPLMGALEIRIQNAMLRMRRVPMTPRRAVNELPSDTRGFVVDVRRSRLS